MLHTATNYNNNLHIAQSEQCFWMELRYLTFIYLHVGGIFKSQVSDESALHNHNDKTHSHMLINVEPPFLFQ